MSFQKEKNQYYAETFRLADRIEARYEELRQHFDQLPQALLAKAFRGELVPQDPEDG